MSDDLDKNNQRHQPLLAIPRLGEDDETTSRPGTAATSILLKVLVFTATLVCGFQASYGMLAGLKWPSSSTAIAAFSSSLTVSNTVKPLLKKKFHPGKKCHHGRVVYTTTDVPGQGRVYSREFTSACAHGILAFSIGPAHEYLPYEFDLYYDEYAYSDNDGMCPILPSYKGTESRKGKPYWSPNDPTQIIVDFGKLTKISTLIPDISNSKPLSNVATSRCGDYVLMAKGDYYTAEFFQTLKHRINSWKVDETIEDIVAEVTAAHM